MSGKIVRQYDTAIDGKNRVRILGASFQYYHVEEYDNGTVVLSPRVLVQPENHASSTFHLMDKSMPGLKKPRSVDPVDLEKLIQEEKA